MNHLLKLLDLRTEEITGILDLADQLKYERKHNIPHELLKGQTLGMIFQKSSTRTRVSFETGMYQLGGHALFLSSRDLQIGRGEPVQDTARVLSRYLDGIMTIREKFGSFSGLKMCFIGDGNNMANSLIVGGLKVGMNVAVATPDGYKPDGAVLEFTKGYGDKFALETDPFMAASGADILITDTWTSMGEEAEKEERKKIFKDYQINRQLLAAANAGAMVQHCLPAYRGQEITEEVFEEHADEIFNEAENRLHAQKAVMVKMMKKD